MIRDVQAWVASRILFPAYHSIKRDGMMPAVRHLLASQWRPADELREYQRRKLSALLRHCERNVPYYRELFTERGLEPDSLAEPAVFGSLPLLTKDVIRANIAKICAENVSPQSLIPNSTSGSTGEPLKFFHDRASAVRRAAVVWRNQEWVGALYSDREVRLWGAQIDIRKTDSLRGRFHSALHQKLHLSSYQLSDVSMRRYAESMRRFKPRLLISYASPLATFADYFQRTGDEVPRVPAIITSAESLYPWQRELIESVFGSRIFDRYGSREFGNVAHQCEMHDGYHVNVERVLVEVLDAGGRPVPVGETGEIVITDLDNYGFPFLRYRTGDLGTVTADQCPCGRGLPLIQRFEGRTFDVVRCPNGERVAGTYWTIALRRFSGVRQFQVVQTARDRITVRLHVDREWQAGTERRITEQVKAVCGDAMLVDYDFTDQFETTGSGKFRVVVNKLDERAR